MGPSGILLRKPRGNLTEEDLVWLGAERLQVKRTTNGKA